MEKGRERTLVILKPTALERSLCGKIIERLERAGFLLLAARLTKFPSDVFVELYQEHQGKDFFAEIVKQMSKGPVMAVLLEGDGVVRKVRKLIGSTDPAEAAPGTIRGDFAHAIEPDNLIHASDSPASARREIGLFFPEYAKD
ncbi:MAG: nucleoside-diphosphate kinase [Halanaerobium sp.]|nr:nucleoside-diphosphate kinase [Halanaerobium sp.]